MKLGNDFVWVSQKGIFFEDDQKGWKPRFVKKSGGHEVAQCFQPKMLHIDVRLSPSYRGLMCRLPVDGT